MLASAIKRESAAGTRVPPPRSPPHTRPPHPLLITEQWADPRAHRAASHWLSTSHATVHVCQRCSLITLSFPHWVQSPFSVAALFTRARVRKRPRHPWADEWIKKLHICTMYMYTKLHIHSGILLIHKKEHVWVHSSEVDESRACYIEWNKSEREKQILYSDAYRI